MKTAREIAVELVARHRRQAVPLTASRADLQRHHHLNRVPYERFRQALESRGYVFLGDFECRELDEVAAERSHPDVFRYMLSPDHFTCAVYHQARRHAWSVVKHCLAMIYAGKGVRHSVTWLRNALPGEHYYDFESVVGGRFLGTSNAVAAAAFDAPPEVEMVYQPSQAWESLHEAHQMRLRSSAPPAPQRLGDFDSIWAMEEQVRQVKHAWREARGIYTYEELTRLTRGNSSLARELHAEIQAIINTSGAI